MANIRPQNKMDDAAVLRAQLEIELKNKKQCTYQTYECTQLCLDGYKFCSKHILQDKQAPFKQCSFIYSSNGKRCHIPAQRVDKREYGYCSEHALKATLARNKQNAKNPPPRTAEFLLHSLSHYIKKPRIRSSSSSTQYSEENDHLALEDVDQKLTKFNDPFVDLDPPTIFNEKCSEVLDFCSESDSDIEASTFSSVWHDAQADSSDNESIDSEQEDPLKHANVYTGEEVTLITRDKLIRLQSLYIEQYRHLQYLLTEKRRKYLHSLKRERETCCTINSQVRDNPKEQRLYKKLKALNNYQKCHGTDGILNKKLKDLRVKISDGSLSKTSTYSKCSFTEGGVKCGERSIPLSKYCQKHILDDPNQVLYRPCGKTTGDVTCSTPIAAIFDESTCHLHLEIPVLRSYSQPRKDSESDIDDNVDAHLQYTSQLTEDIKNEFINYVPPEIPKMETLPTMLFEENSTSNNEVITESNFLFGNDNDPNILEYKMESDSIEEMNFADIPDCLSGEVEISTEVEEHGAKEEDNVQIPYSNREGNETIETDANDDNMEKIDEETNQWEGNETTVTDANDDTMEKNNEETNQIHLDVNMDLSTGNDLIDETAKDEAVFSEINAPEDGVKEVETPPVNDEVATPVNDIVATPVNEEEATPVNEEATPVNEEATPVNEEATPVNEEATPVNEEATPVNEEATPVDEQATPVNEEEAAPINEEKSASIDEVEATPVNEVETTPVSEEMPSISGSGIIDSEMVVDDTEGEIIEDVEMKDTFEEKESTIEIKTDQETSEACDTIQEEPITEVTPGNAVDLN
ncbi:unnamed protein product [Phaedon cochleariae]|uniref:KAT8 regulatory NSL complex subunit 2 n=1 Tax=Phaedon cochleariae TaxID=80249 RepID=A0A9N9SHS4_PHACE|nr:unnamed protein product [Phaedon cochleariae]